MVLNGGRERTAEREGISSGLERTLERTNIAFFSVDGHQTQIYEVCPGYRKKMKKGKGFRFGSKFPDS